MLLSGGVGILVGSQRNRHCCVELPPLDRSACIPLSVLRSHSMRETPAHGEVSMKTTHLQQRRRRLYQGATISPPVVITHPEAQRDISLSSLHGSESIHIIGVKINCPSFTPVRVKRGISGPLWSDEDRGDEPEN